jgi:hypothetical protein
MKAGPFVVVAAATLLLSASHAAAVNVARDGNILHPAVQHSERGVRTWNAPVHDRH